MTGLLLYHLSLSNVYLSHINIIRIELKLYSMSSFMSVMQK